jgi:polysaccharide biosynthesis protein PslG
MIRTLITMLATVLAASPPAPAVTTAAPVYTRPLFALCEDYPVERLSWTQVERDLRTARAAGVRHLRVGIGWDDLEPRPGGYDWRYLDRLVSLCRKHGVTLLPYVCYTPEWAVPGAPDDFWRQPPREAALFGRLMTRVARRYRGRIGSWELWNEPDNPAYWSGSIAEYATLAAAGARGVRRGDPRARVVLGGLAGPNATYLQAALRHAELRRAVDVVNVHGYLETWDNERAEEYVVRLREVQEVLKGSRLALWLAEFGYSSARLTPREVSKGVLAVYRHEHTPEFQAVALVRHHVLALASGTVSLTAWYRINDLPPTAGVIGDANNRSLGLLDTRGRRKPAFAAMRLVTRLFYRPLRCIDGLLQVQRSAGSQAEVHAFQTPSGEAILAGWLRSSRPEEVLGRSGLARDQREETVTVRVPGHFRRLSVCTVTGRRVRGEARLAGGMVRNVRLRGDGLFLATLHP